MSMCRAAASPWSRSIACWTRVWAWRTGAMDLRCIRALRVGVQPVALVAHKDDVQGLQHGAEHFEFEPAAPGARLDEITPLAEMFDDRVRDRMGFGGDLQRHRAVRHQIESGYPAQAFRDSRHRQVSVRVQHR